MDTQKFKVANVKCGGCVANVKNGLSGMAGVREVDVDVATGAVLVKGDASRESLASKLAELGYPEV